MGWEREGRRGGGRRDRRRREGGEKGEEEGGRGREVDRVGLIRQGLVHRYACW